MDNRHPAGSQPQMLEPQLLTQLDATFTRHAGSSQRLDADGVRRALRLRNQFLAERLLALLDRNGDGSFDRDDFLGAVRLLVFGSRQEQLQFAFCIHDIDGDGRIRADELRRMLAMNLGEEAGAEVAGEGAQQRREQQIDEMTRLLLHSADQNNDDSLSYEEFENILLGYPELVDLMARNAASRVLPEPENNAKPGVGAGRLKRIVRFIENRASLVVCFALLAAINIGLFVNGALNYQDSGPWIMLARGCGACLNFDGALVLIPVMRRILTWLRSRWIGRFLPLDDALLIHRVVAYAIMLLGLVHTAAHLVNYSKHAGIVSSLLYTSAGRTGALLLLVSMVMLVFSLPRVRKSGRFELFYFAHFSYVLWFALALLHGPRFWHYALVPLLAFGFEWAMKARQRVQTIPVAGYHGLSSGVTRLELPCPPEFGNRPGDYAFVRIPALARHEWHPFTISSAPGPKLTFHIRSEGDWTTALRKLADRKDGPQSLAVNLIGPFGTASAHILESRHVVMIGAGIGVTPFASVLESLVQRANAGQNRLEKAYFYWLNRDSHSFEWFADLLLRVEQMDNRNLVDIQICMTGGRSGIAALALNLARKLSHSIGKPDFVTGLRAQTRLGAPDFDHDLAQIAARHAPHTVEVYFCGPPGLGRKIDKACRRHGLRFHQEVF